MKRVTVSTMIRILNILNIWYSEKNRIIIAFCLAALREKSYLARSCIGLFGRMKKLNVLSLFDGMSCGRLAINRAGWEIENYYASEIDKYAIQVSRKNFPDTIQLGDVTKVHPYDLPSLDLVIGGSPCQGFSFAGNQLAFEDPRSKLFF